MELQKTNYKNDELNVEINCYVDKKNQIWFRGKEIAEILEYKNTKKAIQNHVDQCDKKLMAWKNNGITRNCFFINEFGFCELIIRSKQPKARELKRWVTTKILPSIGKKYFKEKNNTRRIETENDLHYKVVDFLRNKYGEVLMIAGLGENQRTESIRITSWKKGYMAGQCDLMIMNPTSEYNSLCIEFKSPLGSFQLSKKQQEMKDLYEKNKCKYMVSNSYDDIIFEIVKHMEESDRYISYRFKRNAKNI